MNEREKKLDVNEAHEELLSKLFGSESVSMTMNEVANKRVPSKVYTEAMKEVQDKYGLTQGHPDFLSWVFTCVGRSPIITVDIEEGADQDEPTSEN